jgi:hypothetical protein
MRLGSTRKELRADIDACGYFPELVEDAIMIAVADEDLIDFVVHHEPTFNQNEIHRHVTVLALTPSRLIVGHTDDHPAEEPMTGTFAAASTDPSALQDRHGRLTRVVAQPEGYHVGAPDVTETAVRRLGAVRRADLESRPAATGSEADHGYTGTLVGDDLTVRMSAAADGATG